MNAVPAHPRAHRYATQVLNDFDSMQDSMLRKETQHTLSLVHGSRCRWHEPVSGSHTGVARTAIHHFLLTIERISFRNELFLASRRFDKGWEMHCYSRGGVHEPICHEPATSEQFILRAFRRHHPDAPTQGEWTRSLASLYTVRLLELARTGGWLHSFETKHEAAQRFKLLTNELADLESEFCFFAKSWLAGSSVDVYYPDSDAIGRRREVIDYCKLQLGAE